MKKIQATLSLLATASVVTAQVSATPFVGIHHSNTEVHTTIIDPTGITNPVIGINIELSLDDKLSLRSGLRSLKKGFQVAQSIDMELLGIALPFGAKAITEISYLEVPLVGTYDLSHNGKIRPYLGLGTGLAYATSGTLDTKASAIFDFNVSSTSLDLGSHNYNRIQAMGYALAGVGIPYGKYGQWTIEVEHSRSFTDLISEDFIIDAGGKHTGLGVHLGYSLFL